MKARFNQTQVVESILASPTTLSDKGESENKNIKHQGSKITQFKTRPHRLKLEGSSALKGCSPRLSSICRGK